MNAKQIRIPSDSQLIVNQVTADFETKDASMYAYLSTTHKLLQSFRAYEIKQIPISENSHVDALARLASAINDKIGMKVPVEILAQPSTVASETCTVRYEDTWMCSIYSYLTNDTLAEDKVKARKLRYRSVRYTVINDVLYKRGYTTPYLKCLTIEQGDYVLREIHNGVCGDHFSSRSRAYKAFRQGYFWPTMHQEASSLVKRCDKCQRFGNIPHIPAEPLTPIVSPWPFRQWGLDLIGPMPQAKGQVKYAVVAVDYFTEWVEAEPLATITATKMEDFVWTHICCRFGIPYVIIIDNGRQFDSKLFMQFCTRLKINLFFASPAHPESNGQLDKAKGAWPEKLPEALYAIRTSYRTSSGETPFSLAFGSEAVVPVEIGEPSYQTENFAPKANEEAISLSLNLLEEHRAHANLRNEAYKQRVSRYYDSRVRHRSLRIGDWVVRKISLATKDATEGTLGPSFERPYEIIGDYGNRKGQKSIILEAVASFDTWVWHAFFGVAGSQNDLNVLGQSPVFDEVGDIRENNSESPIREGKKLCFLSRRLQERCGKVFRYLASSLGNYQGCCSDARRGGAEYYDDLHHPPQHDCGG
ncbi:hypothetical protein L3X38_009650 [Prunus dulcis]|uniref:Integrase catalytic domain-containing protein n=1 Tax=Prunus dulcis TaxID=3755 RepID=A0AAD4WE27_PRUDU|nr:hypothetical protein L3X38_009650 [Prunus dulcis]